MPSSKVGWVLKRAGLRTYSAADHTRSISAALPRVKSDIQYSPYLSSSRLTKHVIHMKEKLQNAVEDRLKLTLINIVILAQNLLWSSYRSTRHDKKNISLAIIVSLCIWKETNIQ
jgi:hypothetical protein